MKEAPPVLLFDGVCNLCHASVRFVLDRDPAGTFRFASLQSDAARRLLAPHGRAPTLDGVVLIEDGRVYTESTAALRVARRLHGGWKLLYALVVMPRFVRDAAYRLVARHRYRLFGRQDACRLPRPGEAQRFLE